MSNKDYTALSDDELEKAAADDEPAALYEKGRRMLADKDIAGARKFLTLGSVLGDRNAHAALAGIYEEEDNFEEAYELYALAYAKGSDEVLPRLAKLLMRTDRELGIEILKTNAADGNIDCLKELVATLSGEKEKKELKFWQAKLDALQPAAPDGTAE